MNDHGVAALVVIYMLGLAYTIHLGLKYYFTPNNPKSRVAGARTILMSPIWPVVAIILAGFAIAALNQAAEWRKPHE